ncbi:MULTISPECIES: lipoyl(octanoyl) transferase LipB [Deefgea]|uniref:Octanoyltransferase n=1 Tax=Deefgea chitinilytica TaxID=570276 RepID=A0ABS2C7W4_9NEIS|nr:MULTISPECIES: lipoyl(octanoyl) transferase LipB [Deefgea]MBM5570254.1 lipoyl(octanoyl) transferase LipB [Deefgea chitinilytica]MBM9887483.1 lipoyl(octanoyl) transferase LipB [Deefgea sp. CFH1-16]
MIVKQLGQVDYLPTFEAMQAFTVNRDASTPDELWLLEHPPVFTQGLAGKPEHILQTSDIPIVQIDRGGQVTYHGPGQLVAYLLLDLRRHKLGVRDLVRLLENSVIGVLAEDGIDAYGKVDAPGVYVQLKNEWGEYEAKIASLGLRIKNGCCYHGLALNVSMDLAPFSLINPCGYQGLQVTRMVDLGINKTPADLFGKMADKILQQIKQLPV